MWDGNPYIIQWYPSGSDVIFTFVFAWNEQTLMARLHTATAMAMAMTITALLSLSVSLFPHSDSDALASLTNGHRTHSIFSNSNGA